MSTDFTPSGRNFPRLVPLALGVVVTAFAVATAMLPPTPPSALTATDRVWAAPMTGGDTSVPDAANALQSGGDVPANEPSPTF